MDFDALLLSRSQMGFTLAFHILFPTLNIGLAFFLAFLEAAWLWTGDVLYFRIYRFWVKLFGLAFAVGVVSGVVISYEFGTNFGPFSEATGEIVGTLASYEVLTAFFLESGFLGIMLFGWNRVGRGVHFVATCLVAVGTLLSAFWIMAANSWMQTPAGFIHQNGRFYVADWWAAIFNPSFPYRLVHMSLASLDTTSFVVAGVAAWYLLRGQHEELARKAFSLALWMAAIVAPLQIVAGDQSGLEVLRNQPVKLAAIEALWHDAQPAPFHVFAIPDDQAATNRFELSIPRAGSLILTHSWNGNVKGLDQVGPQDRPPVAIPFFAFRVMVAAGFLMLFVAWIALWLRYKGRLYSTRWYLWACIASMPLGYIATVAGWLVAEVGRQPWTVHGLLRTADSASAVATAHVGTSLALFVLFYCVLLGAWVFYGIRWVVQGPAVEEPPPPVRNVLRDRPMPAVR